MVIRDHIRVVLADPAWKFEDALPGKSRGASKNYDCSPVQTMASSCAEQIARARLALADDAWLFLWRVHTHQAEAHEFATALGFPRYRSEIVWVKQTNDGTRPRIGMGRTIRQAHEVCWLFIRGKPELLDKGVGSVISSPRGNEHSRKPEQIYSLVERFAAGPYLELFARRRRFGWYSIGDQVESRAEMLLRLKAEGA